MKTGDPKTQADASEEENQMQTPSASSDDHVIRMVQPVYPTASEAGRNVQPVTDNTKNLQVIKEI